MNGTLWEWFIDDEPPSDKKEYDPYSDPWYIYNLYHEIENGKDHNREDFLEEVRQHNKPQFAFEYAVTIDQHVRDDTRQIALMDPAVAWRYAMFDGVPRDDTRAAASKQDEDGFSCEKLYREWEEKLKNE